MTATLILNALAAEFSVPSTSVQAVLEMVDAGLTPPFIGRFRRAATGALPESHIRRLLHRRGELEELDRRRGTILRALERFENVPEQALDAVRNCVDRFELEDLFIPHRRPEPEVQLAMDRGLGGLADALVAAVPRGERPPRADATEGAAKEEGAEAAAASPAQAPGDAETPPVLEKSAEVSDAAAPEAAAPDSTADAAAADAPADAPADAAAPTEGAAPAQANGDQPVPAADAPAAAPEQASAPDVAPEPAAAAPAAPAAGSAGGDSAAGAAAAAAANEEALRIAGLAGHIAVTPELARMCEPFVVPDKGVHTDVEALAGALRILSDRLGRDARLRGLLRRMLRKRGSLKVRPLVDAGKAGRHKPLLKLDTPLKQLQGHRLVALRQAQKERILNYTLHLDSGQALPKVRQALGKHTKTECEPLLQEVARQALEARLMPALEADVRLELKERGDAEALRFLAQHLRQLLLTSAHGPRQVFGVDVNAKGDWTLALIGERSEVVRTVRIEVGDKEPAALGAELVAFFGDNDVRLGATGHGKGPRAGGRKLRAALAAAGSEVILTVANEAGLSNYAGSEVARKELPDAAVPERMAISLGRRLQDPMSEFLKVDPRHLALGSEQGLVSKANAKRVLRETIESCVAHVGCVLNWAPPSVLRNMPGLDDATVTKLLEARESAPFHSREQLRAEGFLTEAQWTSVIAFLRLPSSDAPLDRTSLHPEQYDLARRLLESAGGAPEESLGRPGVTKGLKRAAFEVDEHTWRDLMRELSMPGRDPRLRLFAPRLLSPDTDSARLTPGRVIEGVVTAVASFGAFVDVGLEQDAMVHISEVSQRYVRDARELLSIGQTVRARVVDPSGQRMSLSLKDVPALEKSQRGGGGARRSRGRGRGRGRGASDRDRGPKLRQGDARGMPLGGPGGRRRGGGRGRGGSERRDSGDRVDRADLNRINSSASQEAARNNPFAAFFKPKEEAAPKQQQAKQKPKPKPKPEAAATEQPAQGEESK